MTLHICDVYQQGEKKPTFDTGSLSIEILKHSENFLEKYVFCVFLSKEIAKI